MKKEFYTTGELAKLTGVSYKTIRHYREKGLLEASKITEAGYHLYGMEAVEKLEHILLLKYLDFSLEEITDIINREGMERLFERQEQLLIAKKDHLECVINAIKEIQNADIGQRQDKILEIISLAGQKEEIIKQYKEESNLQKRISIHDYSTAGTHWFQWVFEELKLKSGMRILEVGCGSATFWIYNIIHNNLPDNLEIILTDVSEGMLKAAREGIDKFSEAFSGKNISFRFLCRDAENFSMEDGEFDRIMANHMLYHLSDMGRHRLFEICYKLLKKEGMFFASTIGKKHMKEFMELVAEWNGKINPPYWMSESFELENGAKQLEKIFPTVLVKEHEDSLIVPCPKAIYDYTYSLPGNAKEVLKDNGDAYMRYLKSRISKEKPFYIQKHTGAFMAFKN